MIGWDRIIYGGVLSAVAAGVALVVTGRRSPRVLISGVLATLAAPIAWNAILRATHAREFFTDAPLDIMPASWQDTGSGVFTVALATLALGAVVPREVARGVATVATVCGLAAFLVDVYAY